MSVISSTSVVHLSTVHSSSDNRIYRRECLALTEAGVDVVFVSYGPAPEGRVSWVKIPGRQGRRLSRMIVSPLRAWSVLRRLNPAVLHLHDPELIPLGLCWRLARGGAVIYDAHEDLAKQIASKPYLPAWSVRPLTQFAKAVERLADKNFDAIVAATPSIARNFRFCGELKIVQNFPWLREYPAVVPISDIATKSACYVGGLSRIRGSSVMIRALKLSSRVERLHLAGKRDSEATADIADGRDFVSDYGEVSPNRIPAIIASSAVGLAVLQAVPNYLESQPTKVFEYMASGRPFIASDFTYWRELLGPYDSGWFVDGSDPEALAAALDLMTGDPQLMKKMGRNGRKAFEQRFCFDIESNKIVDLTQKLLR